MVTERLQLLLTADAKDAVNGIRDTSNAAKGLDVQTSKSSAMLGGLSSAINPAAAVGALGTMAAASAAFAMSSIGDFTSLADKVRDFSRVAGVGADASSRLVAIFDDLKISQDAADTGFLKLNKGIGAGTTDLERYGAQAVRSKDGNLDVYKTLLSISDAYTSASDSGDKARLVTEAFGKGGAALIPILEKGRKGIEELYAAVPGGQILSESDLENARLYDLAMDDLSDSVQELKVQIGMGLAPALAQVATDGASFVRFAMQGADALGGFDKIFQATTDGFLKSVPIIGPTVGVVKDLAGAFGLGGAESNKFADAQKRLQAAQQDLAQTAADSSSTHRDLREVKRELTAAENEYEGVVKRVNNAVMDNTSRLLENMAAGQAYTNAQLGVVGATLNVETAFNRYNETLFLNGAEALETRQAAHQLETSYVALGQATFDAAVKSGKSQEEAAQAQIVALASVAATFEPGSNLRVWLDQYIDTLRNGIPKNVETRVRLIPSRDDYANTGAEEFSHGGWVGGSGNSDTVPAMLTPGEFVVSKAMLAGRASIPTSVGGGGGGIVIHVAGSVVTERQLIDVVRDGLISAGFSGYGTRYA